MGEPKPNRSEAEPSAVDEGDLAAALGEVLGEPVQDLHRLTGGASRETWAMRTAAGRGLILQRERTGGSPASVGLEVEAKVIAAAEAGGVPVATVVASGGAEGPLGSAFFVAARIEGETIPRKLLRDEAYAGARSVLAAQCGTVLAAIHAVDPSAVPELEAPDQLDLYRQVADELGAVRASFELAFAWLADNRPPTQRTTIVHGDFRNGNLMVGPEGLRAVLDWELVHRGDPMEDLGWLCARAWRFGSPLPVGGFGPYEELFAAYEAASGVAVDPAAVRWWEVLATLKWGVICVLQASTHLQGLSRSVELAAIGRRVCETEWDLLEMLHPEAVAEGLPTVVAGDRAGVHGHPTADELLEAVQEHLAGDVAQATEGRVRFHSKVAANVVAMVRRELAAAGDTERAAAKVRALGYADEAALAKAIRNGDPVTPAVVEAAAALTTTRLAVANPRY